MVMQYLVALQTKSINLVMIVIAEYVAMARNSQNHQALLMFVAQYGKQFAIILLQLQTPFQICLETLFGYL